MGREMVSWVCRYRGQCGALRPLGHQSYRFCSYRKDPPLHSGYNLSMRTAGMLEGWSLTDYQSEYEEILQTLSTGLVPPVIDGHQWYKNNQYLFYEKHIVVHEAQLDGCPQWSHLSSGHTGANCSVSFFRDCFYSSLTLTELRS